MTIGEVEYLFILKEKYIYIVLTIKLTDSGNSIEGNHRENF